MDFNTDVLVTDEERYFYETGLKEGYPPCCCFWFAKIWAKQQGPEVFDWQAYIHYNASGEIDRIEAADKGYWRADYSCLLNKLGFDHILCPSCLLKKAQAACQTPPTNDETLDRYAPDVAFGENIYQ